MQKNIWALANVGALSAAASAAVIGLVHETVEDVSAEMRCGFCDTAAFGGGQWCYGGYFIWDPATGTYRSLMCDDHYDLFQGMYICDYNESFCEKH